MQRKCLTKSSQGRSCKLFFKSLNYLCLIMIFFRAELPADTEVVSEEELPALKKEGKRKHEDYDPSEPTDEVDEKKMKTDGKTLQTS